MRILATILLALIASTTRADAFCGFYVGGAGAKMFNNATQVVLMRHGQTTVLSMQNNYQGPPSKFAMVVPVPVVLKEQHVKTLPREIFEKVEVLGAPRLVEYWESDPCNPVHPETLAIGGRMVLEATSSDGGDSDEDEYKVKIEAKFSVGEYDIVILSAGESTGLEKWLRKNEYAIPDDAAPLLRPYVEQGMKFFVAKVDPKKVKFENGMATLSPLRFHYDSPEFALPIRLGLANSSGAQDLIVNILAPNMRYEVANYPNVTIPTNLVLKEGVADRFGEFYVALFDHAVKEVPNAVVTEYSWDSEKCDPCPGPVLDVNDLATLGADVVSSTYKDVSPWGMTLTRLHARYGKDAKNDLVFRSVQPLAGGRGTPDAQGRLDTAVAKEGINQFQARYAVIHPWTGAVNCENPQRGVWGGSPPNKDDRYARPVNAKPGTNLAFAPRGNFELAAALAKPIPNVSQLASDGQQLPIPVRSSRGCGCATGGASSAGAFALLLAFLLRKRRRS
jgi:MYXO-CTERM domain-containing protein